MSSRNTGLMRSNKKFMKEIEDIQKARITRGKDNVLRPVKPSRITLALTRHALFPKIKMDIIDADLK